jgi:hypothetical protein
MGGTREKELSGERSERGKNRTPVSMQKGGGAKVEMQGCFLPESRKTTTVETSTHRSRLATQIPRISSYFAETVPWSCTPINLLRHCNFDTSRVRHWAFTGHAE